MLDIQIFSDKIFGGPKTFFGLKSFFRNRNVFDPKGFLIKNLPPLKGNTHHKHDLI